MVLCLHGELHTRVDENSWRQKGKKSKTVEIIKVFVSSRVSLLFATSLNNVCQNGLSYVTSVSHREDLHTSKKMFQLGSRGCSCQKFSAKFFCAMYSKALTMIITSPK